MASTNIKRVLQKNQIMDRTVVDGPARRWHDSFLKFYEMLQRDPNFRENFESQLVVSNFDATDGTIYTGAAGEILSFSTGLTNWEACVVSVATGAAVIAPFVSADGLEVKSMAGGTGPDHWELVPGGNFAGSKHAFTVSSAGQTGYYFRAKIKIDDISDVTRALFGFRKVQAYQTDWNDYTDMAALDIGLTDDGRFSITTILNNAATATTDTTLTDWADAAEYTLEVFISKTGVVTWRVDGSLPTVVPAQFTFDSGDEVVPFILLDCETGDPGLSISEMSCGYANV
jgi:hypothetical protein